MRSDFLKSLFWRGFNLSPATDDVRENRYKGSLRAPM
jgi:hypothetical protein